MQSSRFLHNRGECYEIESPGQSRILFYKYDQFLNVAHMEWTAMYNLVCVHIIFTFIQEFIFTGYMEFVRALVYVKGPGSRSRYST